MQNENRGVDHVRTERKTPGTLQKPERCSKTNVNSGNKNLNLLKFGISGYKRRKYLKK